MPTSIGWLAGAAGAAYLADGFGTILLASCGAYAGAAGALVVVTAVAGEGALMLWLMMRGVNKALYPESLPKPSI